MPYTVFIGLGNPKPDYALQRHNYGVMALDVLAHAFAARPAQHKYHGLLQEATHQDQRLFFLAPQTYMNLSGKSAAALLAFYKIPLDCVVVLHDELDIDLAAVRIKQGGGHAGHNGLKSLDSSIGNGYHRVRLGIGRPQHGDVSNYVLGNFTPEQCHARDAVLRNIGQHYTALLQPTPALAAQLSALL